MPIWWHFHKSQLFLLEVACCWAEAPDGQQQQKGRPQHLQGNSSRGEEERFGGALNRACYFPFNPSLQFTVWFCTILQGHHLLRQNKKSFTYRPRQAMPCRPILSMMEPGTLPSKELGRNRTPFQQLGDCHSIRHKGKTNEAAPCNNLNGSLDKTPEGWGWKGCYE